VRTAPCNIVGSKRGAGVRGQVSSRLKIVSAVTWLRERLPEAASRPPLLVPVHG